MRNLIPISVLLMIFSSVVVAEEVSKADPVELNLKLNKDMIDKTPDHQSHIVTRHHADKAKIHKTKHEQAIAKSFNHDPSNADDMRDSHHGNIVSKSF